MLQPSSPALACSRDATLTVSPMMVRSDFAPDLPPCRLHTEIGPECSPATAASAGISRLPDLPAIHGPKRCSARTHRTAVLAARSVWWAAVAAASSNMAMKPPSMVLTIHPELLVTTSRTLSWKALISSSCSSSPSASAIWLKSRIAKNITLPSTERVVGSRDGSSIPGCGATNSGAIAMVSLWSAKAGASSGPIWIVSSWSDPAGSNSGASTKASR